jgi:endogenous inhibitor of DNA gyrase (YacG/DUF329 family)
VKCKVCGQEVLTMTWKGSGFCGENCRKADAAGTSDGEVTFADKVAVTIEPAASIETNEIRAGSSVVENRVAARCVECGEPVTGDYRMQAGGAVHLRCAR